MELRLLEQNWFRVDSRWTYWTETSISLVLPTSRLSTLSNTPRWLIRIQFGRGHTTDSFELKMSAKMARAQLLSRTLPWLIPLIVVIVVAIHVAIFLFVCLRRRKTKQPEPKNEMDAQDDDEVENRRPRPHTHEPAEQCADDVGIEAVGSV
ncbi:hypothetical protein BLNAU_24496 [Blattamonas nauphoetae]|uniref:Uncharacterized protein n=1 Tax=Blattamonas nauphoetae TaxID=2049346 RepID=A0ABQ9WM94_9EUKA|nr:hypothetical protein BLNAU_24496 [Blattamonas nauphoetae]